MNHAKPAPQEMPPTGADSAAERLGTQPVGKLLLRFSIPAITGMLVNALYNVVDRIFVGRGVNETALGGLALAAPLMTMVFAFAMLFGVGAANMISMRLGQGRREEAQSALNHCLVFLAGTGLVVMVLGLIFIDPLLGLMGAENGIESLVYAREYFSIILYGQVFSLVGFGLSHCSRAQGFPMVTMAAMLLGAGLNTVLDPVFIFGFGWGVRGAAWATILSQVASAALVLSFNFSKKAVIRLKPRLFRFSARILGEIVSFGSAQFLLNVAASGVMVAFNISMGMFGAAALGVENGGDVALSGMNIVNTISMLALMPIFGLNQGAQPVLGYNYGAKKYARVLSAYLRTVLAATFICLGAFAGIMLFPGAITRLFAPNGSEALLGFAPLALRVILCTLPINGFQIISSNMFIVTGRPKTAILLSMLRQVILLLPFILLFGFVWGLPGVVAASPVADVLAALVTAALVLIELKKLRALSRAAASA